MRNLSTLTLLAAIALAAAAPACHALQPARAEILPIEDKDRAKMDKDETKRKRDQANMEDELQNMNGDAQCGSVEIGNNDSNQRGSDRIAPRTTTVIVTGNIVNTASCGH